MTHALYNNGALTLANWPDDLARREEADAVWSSPTRTTVHNYALFENLPDLKVMLVFVKDDHVQAAQDKPHIHHAYDGFTGAGLWVRLNPDLAYLQSQNKTFKDGFPDNAANTEPDDWMEIRNWAFPSYQKAVVLASLAAAAEMMDRVQTGNWSDNLDVVLYKYND